MVNHLINKISFNILYGIAPYRFLCYSCIMQQKKLYRSRDNKVLTGLAAGTAKYFRMDPTLVRVILVVLEFVTAGLLIIGYLIVSLIVPKEPLDIENKLK